MYLFDSDILIDYIRLYPPAVSFLDSTKKKNRFISLISVFELLKGCANKEQEARLNRFIKHFRILDLSTAISKSALNLYRVKRWSIGIGIADSLIAATGLSHKLTLVTRNLKHYKGIPSLKVRTPYF